MDLIFTQ